MGGGMMKLPAAPREALQLAIDPALELLPSKMGSDEARVMVLAIMLQESGLRTRLQVQGPARGLAMFERGGVRGVLAHAASQAVARELCAARGCPASENSVYLALASDDVLAAGIARLLLWCDPNPLPAIGDADAAWRCYVETWRPGKPHAIRWAANYQMALDAVQQPLAAA